jgi:fructokinase
VADVLCLGEILVDWVSRSPGEDLSHAEQFTKAPGGAPANTAVGLARQGIPTAFIGRVSGDKFGLWLKTVLEVNDVDVSCVVSDPEAQTRMAYVVTAENGDRKFEEFSRISCADTRTHPDDLKPEMFKKASALHFGSISLINSPASEATKMAVDLARNNHLLVSYDPNVRIQFWSSPDACKQRVLDTLHWADIVKINEDELFFLTGTRDLSAARKLKEEHKVGLFIVTLDARGAHIVHNSGEKTIPGFVVKLVEATGAGDGFNSGVLSGLLPIVNSGKEKNRRAILDAMTLEQVTSIIRRANAIGAITCTNPGAIPALPTKAKLDEFLLQMSAQATS